MVRLNNITIKTRLILGFGLVVLLLVIFGCVLFSRDEQIGQIDYDPLRTPAESLQCSARGQYGRD